MSKRSIQLEQQVEQCQVAIAALAEIIAENQLYTDAVPAIGRAAAHATRAAEALDERVSEFAAALASATSDTASLRDTLYREIHTLREHQEEVATEIGGIRQHYKDVRQVSEDLTTAVGSLQQRVEFVRREILFEMKYGAALPTPDAVLVSEPSIVDTEKVARARENGIKLNLGCGHIPLDNYINVDMRKLEGVDIVADVNDLPFEASTVEEIFSSHLVEHFPQEVLRRQLLPYWRNLLRPSGRLHAIVPDTEAMVNALVRETYDFEDFREVLFGAQDYVGDFHYNALTPSSFEALLGDAGFVDIHVPTAGRRNGKCFEFEIMAHRPNELAKDAT